MVCTPSLKGAPRFSEYVEVDDTGRVTDLSVHPVTAGSTLESLEIYILSKKLLLDMVDYCSAHDIVNFSRGVLQPRLRTLKLMSYVHQGYVARFQSVSGYFQRSMDLLEPSVRDELFNPDRPIRTKDRSNPSTYYGPDSRSVHSLVADGCLIEGEVENSIISRGVIIEKGARVCDSVLMQGAVVRSGASLAYVIADAHGPSDLSSGHRQGVCGLILCSRRSAVPRHDAPASNSFCACGKGTYYEDPVCRL